MIAFSLWSLYFADEPHLGEMTLTRALLWGYGHIGVFAAAALVGGGMRVMAGSDGRESGAVLLIGLSAATFVATLWMIRDGFCLQGRARLILPICVAALIAACWVPVLALELIAAILVLTAIARRRASQHHATV